jgi:hypothetical protein
MEKFKIGDRVRCVENKAALKPHALGYKSCREFVVEFINKTIDGDIYFAKNDSGVFECDLILVKTLPKSFACKNTNPELWDKYIKWLKKEHNGDFAGYSSYCPYYGIDKDGVVDNHSSKHDFDTILSLEEWDEIVNGTETKKEETMKNYTITREQLQKIHDVACSEWKGTILGYSRRNPFGNTIEFIQEEVDGMFKAATLDQTPVLEGIFGKQTREIDLSGGTVDGLELFIRSERATITNALMCVRSRGEYENKAFILNTGYNWDLVKDANDQLCLVPTRK